MGEGRASPPTVTPNLKIGMMIGKRKIVTKTTVREMGVQDEDEEQEEEEEGEEEEKEEEEEEGEEEEEAEEEELEGEEIAVTETELTTVMKEEEEEEGGKRRRKRKREEVRREMVGKMTPRDRGGPGGGPRLGAPRTSPLLQHQTTPIQATRTNRDTLQG